MLYFIPDADLAVLDEGEVGYHRVPLPVKLSDGVHVEAVVYIASAPSNNPALRPYAWYKRFLVEGAREHNLPPEYITSLEAIEAAQDADVRRYRRKRTLVCKAQA